MLDLSDLPEKCPMCGKDFERNGLVVAPNPAHLPPRQRVGRFCCLSCVTDQTVKMTLEAMIDKLGMSTFKVKDN